MQYNAVLISESQTLLTHTILLTTYDESRIMQISTDIKKAYKVFRRRVFFLIEIKVASVRFVAAKDHRKPVMAILQDHFDVPSIVTCFACSRLSICVSGSTLKVRLAAHETKDGYNLVFCVCCVFFGVSMSRLLFPPSGTSCL